MTPTAKLESERKKIFILDTNVILHDSSCLYQFGQHDVAIPITVLEELDKFKKGNDSINYHAREFVRKIDDLSGEKLFKEGVQIGEGLGNLRVRLHKTFHADLKLNFDQNKPDHQILNTSYHVAKNNKASDVILVTKDVNLRMKAKSIGLLSEDYFSDHVKDVSDLYQGRRTEATDDETVNRLYEAPFEVEVNESSFELEPTPNEYIILKGENKSALSVYDSNENVLKRVDKFPVYGITPRNSEQTFALDALTNLDIPLVTVSGKAGTGKTLLALAASLEKKKYYRQIFLSRPVVPLSNKDIGYLPGDIKSKLDPYMQPLFDNLGVIQNQFKQTDSKHTRIKELLEEEKLVISPLSYIRGRSLVKIFFIVDEAQNLTPHEVKTIITRAGEGTKVVFTGDIYQIDHPYLDTQSNGLSFLIEKMQGQQLYAHVNLEKGERSELAELASNIL